MYGKQPKAIAKGKPASKASAKKLTYRPQYLNNIPSAAGVNAADGSRA